MVKMSQSELEELLEGILDKLKEHERKLSRLSRNKSKVDKSVLRVLEDQR